MSSLSASNKVTLSTLDQIADQAVKAAIHESGGADAAPIVRPDLKLAQRAIATLLQDPAFAHIDVSMRSRICESLTRCIAYADLVDDPALPELKTLLARVQGMVRGDGIERVRRGSDGAIGDRAGRREAVAGIAAQSQELRRPSGSDAAADVHPSIVAELSDAMRESSVAPAAAAASGRASMISRGSDALGDSFVVLDPAPAVAPVEAAPRRSSVVAELADAMYESGIAPIPAAVGAPLPPALVAELSDAMRASDAMRNSGVAPAANAQEDTARVARDYEHLRAEVRQTFANSAERRLPGLFARIVTAVRDFFVTMFGGETVRDEARKAKVTDVANAFAAAQPGAVGWMYANLDADQRSTLFDEIFANGPDAPAFLRALPETGPTSRSALKEQFAAALSAAVAQRDLVNQWAELAAQNARVQRDHVQHLLSTAPADPVDFERSVRERVAAIENERDLTSVERNQLLRKLEDCTVLAGSLNRVVQQQDALAMHIAALPAYQARDLRALMRAPRPWVLAEIQQEQLALRGQVALARRAVEEGVERGPAVVAMLRQMDDATVRIERSYQSTVEQIKDYWANKLFVPELSYEASGRDKQAYKVALSTRYAQFKVFRDELGNPANLDRGLREWMHAQEQQFITMFERAILDVGYEDQHAAVGDLADVRRDMKVVLQFERAAYFWQDPLIKGLPEGDPFREMVRRVAKDAQGRLNTTQRLHAHVIGIDAQILLTTTTGAATGDDAIAALRTAFQKAWSLRSMPDHAKLSNLLALREAWQNTPRAVDEANAYFAERHQLDPQSVVPDISAMRDKDLKALVDQAASGAAVTEEAMHMAALAQHEQLFRRASAVQPETFLPWTGEAMGTVVRFAVAAARAEVRAEPDKLHGASVDDKVFHRTLALLGVPVGSLEEKAAALWIVEINDEYKGDTKPGSETKRRDKAAAKYSAFIREKAVLAPGERLQLPEKIDVAAYGIAYARLNLLADLSYLYSKHPDEGKPGPDAAGFAADTELHARLRNEGGLKLSDADIKNYDVVFFALVDKTRNVSFDNFELEKKGGIVGGMLHRPMSRKDAAVRAMEFFQPDVRARFRQAKAALAERQAEVH